MVLFYTNLHVMARSSKSKNARTIKKEFFRLDFFVYNYLHVFLEKFQTPNNQSY